ncbi:MULTISPECIES: respiratory nitrate reductase subunit gamma [Pyrobaculum]|uniref:Nitrate reductase, gamma subunit n=1 Tax=Pyrobaculum arsenaticum (strain DSM 13514 / JCM 11321 / PZ6) TaxID=340102 RepID=A4WJC0_PYRAR|nr:respiratory nitrate reductase subunit gamma [Pyrobaculum arsenaticum]ABP50487.1 Nitrate reductase, gamma subunit [Pyrobaculum arsenaticum DSM 13514]
MFHFIVFSIIGWIALAVLVMGVIYRVARWVAPRDLTGLASVAVISYNWGASSRIGEVLKRILTFYTLRTIDPTLFWGAFLFHWGIFLTLLIGHTALFFTPGQLQALGISPETRKIAAIYLGAAFGFITLIGLVMLWYRRLVKKEVKTFTYLDDWFALSLITLIVLLGVINTVVIHPDYVNTVTPWLINLLSGNIDVATKAISTAHPLVQLHIFLAEVLMIYVPLGKMIHPFSIFFQPTITTAPYKVKGSEEVSIKLS